LGRSTAGQIFRQAVAQAVALGERVYSVVRFVSTVPKLDVLSAEITRDFDAWLEAAPAEPGRSASAIAAPSVSVTAAYRSPGERRRTLLFCVALSMSVISSFARATGAPVATHFTSPRRTLLRRVDVSRHVVLRNV
jgi:hypothetical protein